MKRVLITGNAGSGKTYLSIQLHNAIGIQHYSLDSIVWKPRWQITPTKEKNAKIEALIKKEEWIIDGVSSKVQDEADCVVFLDCSRFTSYWRTFRRNLPYMFKSRPGLPNECPEIKIIPKLIRIIWNFSIKVKPDILKKITESKNQEIYHLKTRAEIINFVNMMKR